ncbi:MAG: flagellar biosynthetic protein FliO [Actinomycetota bacterium]|nr:flagellar biosynthetic protein FliO [Actinomycetota bacterium]
MDTLILALRVVLSLGAVIAVLWLVQRRLSRGAGVRGALDPLKVVARRGLGQKASVVVVETGGQRFVLGVTEHSVNVLHLSELPVEEAAAEAFARSLQDAQKGEPEVAGGAGATGALPLRRRERTAAGSGSLMTPLGGSILSASTWRQAAAAARKGLAG